MTNRSISLTRRQVLCGLAGIGAGTGFSVGLSTLGTGANEGIDLKVELTLVDASGEFHLATSEGSSLAAPGDSILIDGNRSRDADGNVVAAATLGLVLDDVKPGDWWVWKKCIRIKGSAAQITRTTDPDAPDPRDTDGDGDTELRSNENTNAENGQTEPETDVDSSPGSGELGRKLRVRSGDGYGGGSGVGGPGPRGRTNTGTPISLHGDENITFAGETTLNPLNLFFQGTLNHALWSLGADMIRKDANGNPVTDNSGNYVGVSDPAVGTLGPAGWGGLTLSNPIDRGISGSGATGHETTDRYDSDEIDHTAAGPGFGFPQDNANKTTVGPGGDTAEVCIYEKYFLPLEAGNEVQSDSIRWQLTVRAEQISGPQPQFCQFPCPVDPPADLSVPLEFSNSALPTETELFGDEGLDFVALCGPDGINDGDVTLHVTARNDADEPTRVYWEVSTGTEVERAAWKFGNTIRKKEYPNGATSGIIVSDPNVGDPGPPASDVCPSGTSGITYNGAASIDQKNAGDELPRFKQQLNGVSGINLTDEVINRSKLTRSIDRTILTGIRSVRDQDSTGNINEDGTGIVGPTDGEDVIDVGGGNVTVQNYGVILGTVTNTGGNDVAIKTDSAVAGDIGVETTDASGNILKGTGNVKIKSRATVVGDIVTNTDGKNIKVKNGERGDRSEVFGDALTSGGGSVIVKRYGRVSGTAETDGGGNVKVKYNGRVGGDAITSGGGQITVGDGDPSQVYGTADSTGPGNGNVDINGVQQSNRLDSLPDDPAKVFDGVRAGGEANLSEGAVSNGVVSDGDVDVDNSKVCGSVVCDGNVDVDNFSIIAENEDADNIGVDTNDFNIVTDDGELGNEFENFGASVDREMENQTIREGSVIAGKQVSKVQNSFVGGDVVAQRDDIDIPSSVICGDVIAKEGAIDIYSSKTGPPKPIVEELDGRTQTRRRSLIGGVVRADGQDCDIAGATVFANGTTEPDERDDDLAVLVTQNASGGNDLTITDDDAGELQSILKGDVVVNGQLNVDIDNGSRVEGKVEANAGTVSIENATIEGPDPNAVDEDAVIIGDGGKIDQLNRGATIEGNVRVKSGGLLDVSGPATIKGVVCVEPGGTANLGSVTVEGGVKRNCQANTSPGGSSPTNPSTNPSISCPIGEPSPDFPTLDISPSVSSPSFTVPSSDCSNLAFDNTNLDKSTLDLSTGPAGVRSQLNSSGIDVTSRVLSDNLASQHIEEMPDSPSKLTLGGNSPAARIGATKHDSKAVVPGRITLKNDSTVVGAIETHGTFKLKGSSAVAGDVTAATVEAIKNSLLVGDLTTTTAGNTPSIESGSLVCGTVDVAGPIQIKQARVNGAVTAAGNIGEINESTVVGDVTTTQQGDISIKSESLIGGKVDADGKISPVKGSKVTGPLEADGSIGSIKQSEIGGDVRTTDGSNGTVTVEESTVDGSIDADGTVSAVKSNSKIGGDVAAGGDIPELKNSVVEGEVKTKQGSNGAITLEGAEIGGPVTADGRISAIKSRSEIGGDVTAKGDVSAIKGSQVDGDVTTTNGGRVKVKNSDIDGLIDADGKISAIKSKSKVSGDVTAGGNISELKGSDVGGKVTTTDGGDVTVKASTIVGGMDIDGTISKIKASDVGGNVDATDIVALKGAQIGGDVTVTDGSQPIAITKNNRKSVICGTVETSGRVEKIKNSTVIGSVNAAQVGKLKGQQTEVGGKIKTADSSAGLKIKGRSTVYDDVDAAGPIPEINSSTVEGKVTAGGKVKVKNSEIAELETTNGGNVKVKGGSTVDGSINANGRVKVKNSTINGTIDANGDVVLKGNMRVGGDVIATGTVRKTSSVIVTGDIKQNQ